MAILDGIFVASENTLEKTMDSFSSGLLVSLEMVEISARSAVPFEKIGILILNWTL